MLRSTNFRANSTKVVRFVRWNSTEEQKKKEEAAKLAVEAIKDMGSMFSSGQTDKETEPIDTEPIFQDPSKFGSLSLLHQGQILNELQKKFDGKWHKLTDQDKKLGYYIAYGNWGVREKFDNWKSLDKPYDLPFYNHVNRSSPSPKDQVKKLEPVNLAETDVRKPQFDTKKMDPVTKTFIYLTLFVCVFALYRDKKIGEEGKPQPIIVRDLHEEERQRKKLEAEKKVQSKKWYYLWLK